MKRLLCIVSSMDTGGAETFLMKMYRHLDRTEYQMDFIAVTDKEGHYDKEIHNLGGKIYNVSLHTKNPLKTFREIKQIVRNGKYEIVLKLLASPIGVFDLLAARAGGATRLCARSTNSITNESMTRKCINSILRRELCRITTVKLAPSDLAARYTFGDKTYDNKQVIMLHNALDLNTYIFSEESRQKVRKQLGIEDSFVVGHIGRFTPQKNHKFLLKLFADLRKIKTNAKLVLVGTGGLQDEIISLANDLKIDKDIIFTGVRDDIPDLLSGFDVFVLPSLYEGMPNTCIEAQATGLRCLIADTITKQADITGNVEYIPISDTKLWVEAIMQTQEIDRLAVNTGLRGTDYDIESEVKHFISSVLY